jgi:hypothetical protein
MRVAILWSGLAYVAVCFSSVDGQPVDTGKLDRTIAKEPRYESKSPWYCLLLFGPEKTMVWLILDGDKLYIDRNGNGDLTEPGECFTRPDGDHFFRVPDLSLGDGKRKYSDLRINWRPTGVASNGKLHLHVIVQVKDHDEYAMVPAKAEAAAEATLIHFDGPLTPFFKIEAFKRQDHFIRGNEHLLGLSLVTNYEGVEWVQVSHEKGIPADVHPTVDIEFPAKGADAKSIRVKVPLKGRC